MEITISELMPAAAGYQSPGTSGYQPSAATGDNTPAAGVARSRQAGHNSPAADGAEAHRPGAISPDMIACGLFKNGICRSCTCGICGHTGQIINMAELKRSGQLYVCNCRCTRKAVNDHHLRQSGLWELAQRYTFDTYRTPDARTDQTKKAALRFLDEWQDHWFFIGGQSGSGKTHICTALCNRLSEEGRTVRYFRWVTDSAEMKGLITDGDRYREFRRPLVQCDVLYIDDLFKTAPREADIRLAYDLLNERYNAGRCTVISSELPLDRIRAFDNAIAGRINEKCRRAEGSPFVILCDGPRTDHRMFPFGAID